jgi:hypothetical protein
MKIQHYLFSLAVLLGACDGFLDEKPTKTIDTPDTLEALDALLSNSGSLNTYPTLPMMLAGDFISDDAGITAMPPWEQNLHLWKSDPFQIDDMVYDFRNCYNQIQNANIVLENLEKIDSDDPKRDGLKGTALFYRAHAYYNLSSLFLEGPNLKSAGLRFEIPIRTTTSMVTKAEFGGLEMIKQRIKEDLEEAIRLLPEQVRYSFRPNKKAAKALKARVSLSWEEYDTALEVAAELVEGGLGLMDYNDIDGTRSYPFEQFNPEVLWQSRMGGYDFMYSHNSFQTSPELLDLYQEGDLRRSLYFIDRNSGFVNFRGSYEGTITLFGGIASDEVYLIYAECLARSGQVDESADVLYKLLSNRYMEGFEPVVFGNENEALEKILEERRKELVFRGLRWNDLRRLNKDDRFKTTLRRSYEGNSYELAPDSEKYVLPIPARELGFR